jgi:hypothetical protein
LRTGQFLEEVEDQRHRLGVGRVGRGRHPDLFRRGYTRELAMKILGKDPCAGSRRFRQHHSDDVVLALAGMGDVIAGPDSCRHLDTEVPKDDSLFAGGKFLPSGGPEIGRDHREELLITVGSSPFQVDSFEHGSGVAETGFVVDVIMKLELFEGCLNLADGPATTHSEEDVARDPGDDLAYERPQSDQLDGGPSQRDIGEPGGDAEGDATRNSKEEKSSENRHEEEGAGYFNWIDSPGQRHQAHDSDQYQPRHEEEGLGAFKGQVDPRAHRCSVWGCRRVPEYHRGRPVPALFRPRLAVLVLFGVFLIPVVLSSLRGLTHVVSCTREIARPFEVAVGDEERPVITGSAVVEAGVEQECGGALEVDVSVSARGPNEIAVTVPITNEGLTAWRGTVRLRVGRTVIPFQIGLVPAGETRSETIVLRLPDGTTGFSGSLLIGP